MDIQIVFAGIIPRPNLTTPLSSDDAQAVLQARVQNGLANGFIVFVIGGSGDLAPTNMRALMAATPASKSVIAVNVDSRLIVCQSDVPHSGTWCCQLLDNADFQAPNGFLVEFDASEFNPQIEKRQTGRLVTQKFHHFCLGVARHAV
ncbi:hypothetical protein GGF31_004799 [Allomyces arbusculus]|nr:hypothetical protein GGF31_004799 [Allomyces arbusculus]